MASNCTSKRGWIRTPFVFTNSLNDTQQVHTIMAMKRISKLGRSWSASASLISVDLGLHLHLPLGQSQPPSVYPPSLANGLQVPMIMTAKCISNRSWSWPPSLHDHCLHVLYQQNVNRSRSHRHISWTLRSTSQLVRNHSRCSQAPLEVSKVLWDSARAFSGVPKSTCSYGSAFWMLWNMIYRIRKF